MNKRCLLLRRSIFSVTAAVICLVTAVGAFAGVDEGIALYKQGKVDEAIAEIRKTADANPKDAVSRRWLGYYLLKQGKPVLGVCRGAQLVNVAYGGTLYQDIELQVPQSLNHRNWDIYDQNFHAIEFVPGTKLAQLYPGVQKSKINTIHHQAQKEGIVYESAA